MNPEFKRKTFIGLAVAAVATLASRVFGQQSTGGNVEKALNSEGLTEQRTRELLSASLAIAVPLGSVVSLWGTKASLDGLKDWELCDGTPVRNPDSPLHGKVKPNLVDRFVMGCGAGQDPQAEAIVGGMNAIPARSMGRAGAVNLTLAQMPRHSHPHAHYLAVNKSTAGSYLGDVPNQSFVTGGQRGADSKYALAAVPETPNAGASGRDDTPAGNSEAHDHPLPDLPPHDNRPSFIGLYYIIRVL